MNLVTLLKTILFKEREVGLLREKGILKASDSGFCDASNTAKG